MFLKPYTNIILQNSLRFIPKAHCQYYIFLYNNMYLGFCDVKPLNVYLLSVSTFSLMIATFDQTCGIFCIIKNCCRYAKYTVLLPELY